MTGAAPAKIAPLPMSWLSMAQPPDNSGGPRIKFQRGKYAEICIGFRAHMLLVFFLKKSNILAPESFRGNLRANLRFHTVPKPEKYLAKKHRDGSFRTQIGTSGACTLELLVRGTGTSGLNQGRKATRFHSVFSPPSLNHLRSFHF